MTVLLQLFTLLFIWRIIDEKILIAIKYIHFLLLPVQYVCLRYMDSLRLLMFRFCFSLPFFCGPIKDTLQTRLGKYLFSFFSMAGLVYSKYQAVLVIGFVVISNIKLLKSYKFWMAGIFALILFTPHLWWQIANDYPSFKFHLIERTEGFRWHHILEYIPNQMAVFNPFVLGAVFYIMVKNKTGGSVYKGVVFSDFRIHWIFRLTAFRGHVEPHWTISCSVAMIILIYNNSTVNPKMFLFIRKALLPIVLII